MQWYWLIHHNILLEALTEPIEHRIAYIRATKPTDEIDTRLLWMRPVQHPERIPIEIVEAWKACFEARKAFVKMTVTDEAATALNEAWKAYDEAQMAYHGVETAFSADVAALHAEECPGCPWNGKELVFPAKTK